MGKHNYYSSASARAHALLIRLELAEAITLAIVLETNNGLPWIS